MDPNAGGEPETCMQLGSCRLRGSTASSLQLASKKLIADKHQNVQSEMGCIMRKTKRVANGMRRLPTSCCSNSQNDAVVCCKRDEFAHSYRHDVASLMHICNVLTLDVLCHAGSVLQLSVGDAGNTGHHMATTWWKTHFTI